MKNTNNNEHVHVNPIRWKIYFVTWTAW